MPLAPMSIGAHLGASHAVSTRALPGPDIAAETTSFLARGTGVVAYIRHATTRLRMSIWDSSWQLASPGSCLGPDGQDA